MHGHIARAAVVIAFVSAAAPAVAQTAPRTVSVEAGAALVYQSGVSDEMHVTYVTAPGGLTLGWVVGAGIELSHGLAATVDLSSTGRMRATEPSRYFMTFDEERRDRMLAIGVRYALAPRPWIAFEPTAGVALTFPQAWSRTLFTDPLALRPPAPRIRHVLDTGVGPMFGLDVRLGGGRVSVVPGVRIVRNGVDRGRYDESSTSADREIESIYPGGYPRWTTRSDVKLRVRF